MDTVANSRQDSSSFVIVCDERCTVVRNFGALVKWWDTLHVFTFVDRESVSPRAKELVKALDQCQWSLLLIDDDRKKWAGPEAIPMILKNLPFGKMAAVLYILPGTMWLTEQAYLFVSRNRRLFSSSSAA
jgi:predicted DCC family thiol-disulfide oxidoreductase YuxK